MVFDACGGERNLNHSELNREIALTGTKPDACGGERNLDHTELKLDIALTKPAVVEPLSQSNERLRVN